MYKNKIKEIVNSRVVTDSSLTKMKPTIGKQSEYKHLLAVNYTLIQVDNDNK